MKKLFIGIFVIFLFNLILENSFATSFNQDVKMKEKNDTLLKIQRLYQDPDTYAQKYAKQKGITLDEAKKELREKYGNPEKREDKKRKNPLGLNPEEQQLFEAGVPKDVIKEGDDAIMNFLIDNRISNYPKKQFIE